MGRYGKKSMLWYIMVCSMIGGISVSVTTGLGSAIVTTAMGDNQFKHWFIYFLMVFIAITLSTRPFWLDSTCGFDHFCCSYGSVLSERGVGVVQYR